MDINRVNAAVKISITLDQLIHEPRRQELVEDLYRLKNSMTREEYSEYIKRVAK